MSMKDWIVNKLGGVSLDPSKTVVIGNGPKVAYNRRGRELAPGIRVGSWVRWGNRTGIAHPGADGLLEVHIVDDETGSTVLITHQHETSLRKATASEIPACRRPAKDVLQRLGYAEV
jgi:hypothetical protein